MKMIRACFFLALTTAFAAPASAQLAAWWKFDETSGSTAFAAVGGVDGTLSGASSFVGGVAGNAIQVSQAGSGFVDFGDNYGLVGTSYTLSFWINATTTSPDQLVLGKHRATIVAGYFAGLNQNVTYGSPNKIWGYQSALPGNQPISTTNVNDGVWHHVAIAFEAGSFMHSIYVDGGLAEDTRIANPMVATTASFMVGGIHNSSGTPISTFTGMVDDLQIYTNRLNDNEIGFLASNPGSAVPEPATVVALAAGGAALLRRRKSR